MPPCLTQLSNKPGDWSSLMQTRGLSSRYALHETHLHGLLQTDRKIEAAHRLDSSPSFPSALPPQWHTIVDVTIGEVLLARGDTTQASASFSEGLTIARQHRLPHQVQRVVRATATRVPELSTLARHTLAALRTVRQRSTS